MKALAIGLCALCLATIGCGEPNRPPPVAARRPLIATSFQPLYWMARTLAGGDADVYLMPPAEADPATWSPDDAAIRKAWAADLVLINGADFEGWPGVASLPVSRLVDASAPLRPLLRPAGAHAHGPGAQQGVDPHLWLDPRLARRQLAVVVKRMAQVLPTVDLAPRRARIEASLTRIEADLRRLGEAAMGQRLLANHQAYDYLAAAAGLQIHSLDVAPDAAASAAPAICRTAKAKRSHLMLWEDEPSAPLAQALLACGVASVVLRPMDQPPVEGDHEAAHRADLAKLSAALTTQGR